MRTLAELWERLFGPASILAEPGYDPTIDPPLHNFHSRRGSSSGLPWLQILFFAGCGVVFFFGFLKPRLWPVEAAGPTGTASETATATVGPTTTPGPTDTPSRTPIPSRTPYGTPFGQKVGGPVGTPTPVVNFAPATERALQTLIAAASASPVVIIEHTGGGGCGDCSSGDDPLPTYTPYPTLEPLQALPTYTPLPTYTALPTLEPTSTQVPTPIVPDPPAGPYRLYLPLLPLQP